MARDFEPAAHIRQADTIPVINICFLEHGSQVDEWVGQETERYLRTGEAVDTLVPDDAEEGQEYEFYCSVAGHRAGGMVGTLTVLGSRYCPSDGEEGDDAFFLLNPNVTLASEV